MKKQKEIDEINESEKIKKKSKLKIIVISCIIIMIIFLAIKSAISIYIWQNLALEIIQNEASEVLDIDGNIIAEIGVERNRENVSFSEIPQNLKNAYVAIEDERFYKHHGIDVKRTSAAIGSYIIHFGKASFGGSTITQQLVKNITGDDSASVKRKVNEWGKSIELEWVLCKDEILESYLNIIYVGPNIYGVQTGSKYYFNKDVSELDLVECAFLAGINISPNSYNPFKENVDNTEKIEKRVKIVLNKMLELNYITEDEFADAIIEVENGITFQKGILANSNNDVYSYHTDATISEVISEISKCKNISTTFATNYLYMANLKIYSTQNSEIQKEIEKEMAKNKYILKSTDDENATSQAAFVIIDHKTGQVVGAVGGLGKKTENRVFNRVTQAVRQTGSSSKPLAVIAPAISEKIITPITTYNDELTTFIDENGDEYNPTNYNGYLGNITVRRAVESSQNIPFVKIMEQLTPEKSMQYLKKMGITTLTQRDANLALALGGLDNGITPLEMAGAYSTIANNGIYIEPTFYTKVTTNEGIEVLKTTQKKRRVFSESVAFVTKNLLTQPVVGTNGTATYCKITGIDVSAKTGTTNDDFDRWLCGFTNYYTAVAWYGYDLSETIKYNNQNPAGLIWASVMKQVHRNLEGSKFEKPARVLEKEICITSGKTANPHCTNVYTEYFVQGTAPGICTIHK